MKQLFLMTTLYFILLHSSQNSIKNHKDTTLDFTILSIASTLAQLHLKKTT